MTWNTWIDVYTYAKPFQISIYIYLFYRFSALAHVQCVKRTLVYLQKMILHLNIYIEGGDLRNTIFAPSQFNQDTVVASGNRSNDYEYNGRFSFVQFC